MGEAQGRESYDCILIYLPTSWNIVEKPCFMVKSLPERLEGSRRCLIER